MKSEENEYQKKANDFLKKTGATISVEYLRTGKYFPDDKDERDIYRITIKRGKRSYSAEFGQSIKHSGKYKLMAYRRNDIFNKKPAYSDVPNGYRLDEIKPNPDFEEPGAYDFLASLQKYEVGSFEDFVNDFGYDAKPLSEYEAVKETYDAVKNEYQQLCTLFTEEEMDLMREIQ